MVVVLGILPETWGRVKIKESRIQRIRQVDMVEDFTRTVHEFSFRRFFDSWQAARVGDDLPARKAITLRDFAPFVSDLLIYEHPQPGILQCRLMGEHISDRVKIYNRHVNWLDLVADDMHVAGTAWWSSLFAVPCAGVMQFSTGFLNGTNRISRAYLLPIQHAPGVVHLLGLASASDVYETGNPREKLIISEHCFQTKYVDIGFGIPADLPEASDHKVLKNAWAKQVYRG